MKKLTEKQKEYISFLPETIKKQHCLTPIQKAVLGKLIQVHIGCSNHFNAKPYFYVGNREMKEDLKIGHKTIKEAIDKFIKQNLIFCIYGVQGTKISTHFILLFDENGNTIDRKKEIEILKADFNQKVMHHNEQKWSTLQTTNGAHSNTQSINELDPIFEQKWSTLMETMEIGNNMENMSNTHLMSELTTLIGDLKTTIEKLTEVIHLQSLKISELDTKIDGLKNEFRSTYNTILYNTIPYYDNTKTIKKENYLLNIPLTEELEKENYLLNIPLPEEKEERSTVDKNSEDKIRIEEKSLDKNRKEKFIEENETIEKENDLNNTNTNLREKEENNMEEIIKKLGYSKKLEEVKTVDGSKTLAIEVYEQLLSMDLEEPLLSEVKGRLHQDWVKRINDIQQMVEEEQQQSNTESLDGADSAPSTNELQSSELTTMEETPSKKEENFEEAVEALKEYVMESYLKDNLCNTADRLQTRLANLPNHLWYLNKDKLEVFKTLSNQEFREVKAEARKRIEVEMNDRLQRMREEEYQHKPSNTESLDDADNASSTLNEPQPLEVERTNTVQQYQVLGAEDIDMDRLAQIVAAQGVFLVRDDDDLSFLN